MHITKNFSHIAEMCGKKIDNLTSKASSSAKKMQSAAENLRDAAFKTWNGKLKDFSPAKLAELAKKYLNKLPVEQAQQIMQSVSAEFMAGLGKLQSKLQSTAANLAHPDGPGYHHAGPQMAPEGCFQSPWRFSLTKQTSTAHWEDTAGLQWQSSMNQRSGSHTSATKWSEQDAKGVVRRRVKDHKTGYEGSESYNAKTKQYVLNSVLTGPDAEGLHRRINVVYNSGAAVGTVWHESINERTGTHVSVGDWGPPNVNGNSSRATFNHKTQEHSYERFIAHNNEAGSQHTSPLPPQQGPKPDNAAPPPQQQRSGETAAPQPGDGVQGPSAPAIPKPPHDDYPLAFRAEKAFPAMGLPPDASLNDVKKAYHKLSLKHHPDKTDGDHETFQHLSVHFHNLKQYFEDNQHE